MRICCSLFVALGSCTLMFNPDPDAYIEQTDSLCGDGVDNDNEGGADCSDPKCALTEPCTACGNGRIDDGETCDDGDDKPGDDCDPNCQLPGCGNGFLAPEEVCLNLAGSASIGATSDIGGIALGDFQGDGFLDLAVGDFGTITPSVVFISEGVGAPLGITSFPVVSTSSLVPDVAVGDLNGDGLDDFAVPVKFSHAIGVFLSAPPGFSFTELFTAGPPVIDETFGIDIADMDQDGDLDISTSNFITNNVSIFLNDGDGRFDPLSPVLVSISPGIVPERLALGDINKDGVPDLVTANTSSSDISVVLSNGPLSYSNVPPSPFSGNPQDLALRDLNDDGFADLVLTDVNLNRVLTFFGSADGLSQQQEFFLPQAPCGVSLNDIDNDGDIDAVVGNLGNEEIQLFFNQGDGNLSQSATPLRVPGASACYVASGDINKDGFPDLAVSDILNSQAVFFINQP